tara:strand:- start:3063 stop:3755 length:693 start_codon:yes stop_codon:yes gene_type:complete
MGLIENHVRENPAKETLLKGLVNGDISQKFEILREYTYHEGGRNIVGNSLSTVFFTPWIIIGPLFIILGFVALFGPDSEVPILITLCCIFPGGVIATMIGIAGLRASLGEMVNPDDYVEYEVNVYFNRRDKYLAEVNVILDATDEDLIGDINFVNEITLSKKSRIRCNFSPGSDGAVRPDFNNFIVSHGDISIQLDHHTFLNDNERNEIAKKWSKRLGVEIETPLVFWKG